MPDPRPSRIGLLAPMPSEHAPLVRRLALTRLDDDPTRRHRGTAAGIALVVDRTGIGTRGARLITTRLLDEERVDHVMVVGIAGGIGATRVGDLVIPERVVDQATGCSYRATPLAGPEPHGTIATSDEIVVDPETVDALLADGVVALDMETAAVAAVCEARGVPWSAVRAISDLATDHLDDTVLQLTNPDGSPRVGAALRYMVSRPGQIPRLARLARGATAAARTAADAAARILEEA